MLIQCNFRDYMGQSFDEWQESQNLKLISSKRRQIELLFDEIKTAQEKGAKIWHILNWLNQAHKLNINQDYLNNTLYRIKKARNNESKLKQESIKIEPLINKPINKSKHDETKKENKDKSEYSPENWEKILDKFYAENNPHDRYLALGGKLEDIEGKSLSSKRDMVTQLKHKLERKYKGIY